VGISSGPTLGPAASFGASSAARSASINGQALAATSPAERESKSRAVLSAKQSPRKTSTRVAAAWRAQPGTAADTAQP
jgi:hypothetical protein